MRCLRSLGSVCLIWLWSSCAVFADCDRLLSVVQLAEGGLKAAAGPDKNRLLQINKLISDIDNEAVLKALRQSGQAHSFSSLRHFLTILMVISDRPEEGFNQLLSFEDDLAQAVETIRRACNTQSQLSAISANGDGLQGMAGVAPSGKLQSLPKWVRDIKSEVDKHREQLRVLGVVMLGLIFAVLLAVAAHFALIALRIIYRGRSICDVPITMDILGQQIEGRITILGKLGCFIVPAVSPATGEVPKISRGTYFNINVDEQTLNAKTLVESTDAYSVMFSKPLTHKRLRQILATSHVPVHYDLSTLHWRRLGRLHFGIGSLPNV